MRGSPRDQKPIRVLVTAATAVTKTLAGTSARCPSSSQQTISLRPQDSNEARREPALNGQNIRAVGRILTSQLVARDPIINGNTLQPQVCTISKPNFLLINSSGHNRIDRHL
jgi:hypothetical protein